MNISDSVRYKKFLHCILSRNGGVCFLLKPAGYLRDRRGIFLNRAGFKRDIGGVSQLMETQVYSICKKLERQIVGFCWRSKVYEPMAKSQYQAATLN